MKTGDILFNKYRIVKRLGSGGMSEVYLCTSLDAGSNWAVKHIHPSTKGARPITAEERILKQLNHTNLPKIIDIFHDASGSYIVESYIQGVTLDKKLHQRSNIALETKLEWALELCNILVYLHSLKPCPIIYRDLKPSNIMVTPDDKIVLVDFGISKEYDLGEKADCYAAGTFCYAAPEQLVKGGYTDQRSDIYSLGITLHQLFFGILPEKAGDAGIYLKGRGNERLYKVIKQCTAIEVEKRYQSVQQLKSELKQIRNNLIARSTGRRIRIGIYLGISLLLSFLTYAAVILGLLRNN